MFYLGEQVFYINQYGGQIFLVELVVQNGLENCFRIEITFDWRTLLFVRGREFRGVSLKYVWGEMFEKVDNTEKLNSKIGFKLITKKDEKNSENK